MKKIWFVAMCTTLVLVGSLGTIAKPSSVAVSNTKEGKCLLHGWVGWIDDENCRKLPASNMIVKVCNMAEGCLIYNVTTTNETGYYQMWVDRPGWYKIQIWQEYGCFDLSNGTTLCLERWLDETFVNISSSDDEKVVNFTRVHKLPRIILNFNNIPEGEYPEVMWAIGEKGYMPPWLLAVLYKAYFYKENCRLPLLETLIGILAKAIFYPEYDVDRSCFTYQHGAEGTYYCLGPKPGYYTIVAMTPSSFASKEIYIEQWGQEVDVTLDLSNPPLWYKLL